MIETKQNSNFRRIYKGVNIRYMRKMWDEKMWDGKMWDGKMWDEKMWVTRREP
jgi:hypothetical protein